MTIDLSLLPPPDVIETLDFEAVFAARKERFLANVVALAPADLPAFVGRLELESEPVTLLLQELAYAELLLRQRVNEAARQCMLASASGGNLDNLAAFHGVERLVTDPGDAAALPPIPPTFETDDRLRHRAQLAVEGMSTAGPTESYRFHALSAHGDVDDASVISPTPGRVVVTILSNDGDGTPSEELLAAVNRHLNAEHIRPLTDEVIVQGATLTDYRIAAELTVYPGPAPSPILAAAQAAVEKYVTDMRRLDYDITLAGLFAALKQPGVQNVVITSPEADIAVAVTQCANCIDIDIRLAEVPHV
ncbi:MAG: baseplate J/gp47 family protein [Zoogloeaceae bacterium]|jgi:phage-related baseplate assembly protein|nr:baseplate J/gp47 family protein [Zoogloeaceae bacterium]